ncbi:MAG: hypothetical protein LBT09_13050 [Planctomycetaceae bacterium]|jgi:hypothetical protein|nr:hypothetical protein [Planctomycetaceae bacterium]
MFQKISTEILQKIATDESDILPKPQSERFKNFAEYTSKNDQQQQLAEIVYFVADKILVCHNNSFFTGSLLQKTNLKCNELFV